MESPWWLIPAYTFWCDSMSLQWLDLLTAASLKTILAQADTSTERPAAVAAIFGMLELLGDLAMPKNDRFFEDEYSMKNNNPLEENLRSVLISLFLLFFPIWFDLIREIFGSDPSCWILPSTPWTFLPGWHFSGILPLPMAKGLQWNRVRWMGKRKWVLWWDQRCSLRLYRLLHYLYYEADMLLVRGFWICWVDFCFWAWEWNAINCVWKISRV